MQTIKTDKQHLIDLRNMVARRMVDFRANMLYFREVVKTTKKVSQEVVDANNDIELNISNLKKDTLFLKIIDKMLKETK